MKQVFIRFLFVSVIAIAAAASPASAQQDPSVIGVRSIDTGGVKQVFVATPDGTFQVQDDGSLVPVETGAQVQVSPPTGVPNAAQKNGAGAQNNGAKVAINPGVIKTPADMTQLRTNIMAQSRQQTENALRDALGCNEEEWAVVLPKIHAIQALQSAVLPGASVRSVKAGNNGDVPSSIVDLGNRVQEFHDLLSNKETPNTQITQSLNAVREARNNVKAKLAQARKELIELLTLRQEAILFERGILAD